MHSCLSGNLNERRMRKCFINVTTTCFLYILTELTTERICSMITIHSLTSYLITTDTYKVFKIRQCTYFVCYGCQLIILHVQTFQVPYPIYTGRQLSKLVTTGKYNRDHCVSTINIVIQFIKQTVKVTGLFCLWTTFGNKKMQTILIIAEFTKFNVDKQVEILRV